jgi:Fur family ferric uptake transcriptional regulator
MERHTRQRAAIRQVIETARRPLSTQEILELAQSSVPGMGIATVYRNVKALLDERDIDQVSLPGEAPRYERARQPHHHHFQCTRCQRVFDVFACPGGIQQMVPPGFVLEHHEVTLYGRCGECSSQQGPLGS